MKHSRSDYDPIQDPSGKIPEDEPVILFRAQDKHCGDVAQYYMELCQDDESPDIAESILNHIPLIEAWPVKKTPDLATNFAQKEWPSRRVLWVWGVRDGVGDEWSIRGLFDTEGEAIKRCINSTHFIGPMPVNLDVGEKVEDWPGCYYPTEQKKPDADWSEHVL